MPETAWTLQIPDDCDWMEFVTLTRDATSGIPTATKLGKVISGNDGKGKNVTLFIHDYMKWVDNFAAMSADEKIEFLKSDYRKAELVVTTGNKTNKVEIRQYNAIPVSGEGIKSGIYENGQNFGVSRLDFGHEFIRHPKGNEPDAPIEECIKEGSDMLEWGYNSNSPAYIFNLDEVTYLSVNGMANLFRAYGRRKIASTIHNDRYWPVSLMGNTCGEDSYNSPASNNNISRLKEETVGDKETGNAWFVPASLQQNRFADLIHKDNNQPNDKTIRLMEAMNLHPAVGQTDKWNYWTLTTTVYSSDLTTTAYYNEFLSWSSGTFHRGGSNPAKCRARLIRYYDK